MAAWRHGALFLLGLPQGKVVPGRGGPRSISQESEGGMTRKEKMELFRSQGFHSGMARSRLEPIKPEPGFPTEEGYGYLCVVGGSGPLWLVLCQQRYHWFLGQLVAQGVSIEHFSKDEIPKKKCLEIARALNKLVGYSEDCGSEQLLEMEIAFWSHCGGVRIHPWGDCYFQD